MSLHDRLAAEGLTFVENEPMSAHTSFKIGGPAQYLVTVGSLLQLCAALGIAQEENVPFRVLGAGTNMLVPDEGLEGITVRLGEPEYKVLRLLDGNMIYAGAGVSLQALCRFALDNSLSGLEFAFGIPGSVGGGVFMNAGAYGGELKDVVDHVYCLDLSEVAVKGFTNEQCDFSYRHSIFSGGGYVIGSAVFSLTPGDKEEINAKMLDVMGRRKDKQPLDMPSAGSVFKRPVGYYAGALIEQCGLKGASVGGAQVSTKHSGFIVNTGGATCADVLALVKKIQDTVLEQTGVALECEIRTMK